MEESINNIFAQLAQAIETQSATNREREEARDAKMARISEGLIALAHLCSANDNELGDQPIASANARPELKKDEHHGGRARIEDSELIDALTYDWITAGAVRKFLIARGITIAEGTVYNRMRKLASDRPAEIEVALKPERWRLRSPRKVNSPACHRVKSAAKRAAVQSQHLSIVPTARTSFTPASSGTSRPVLHHGDCLEVMKALPDDSVDLILADLPYGTTHLGIDARLNLDELWSEYRRILRKPHGNIVLFAVQPFTTALINAAPDLFKYPLVWMKDTAVGFQFSCSRPLMKHEDILVFSFGVNYSAKRSKRRATYNDQHAVPIIRVGRGKTKIKYLGRGFRGHAKGQEYVGRTNCQNTILNFPKDSRKSGEKAHPFAKPLALLEHLVRTYSNEGDVVLDNTMGSGSTCIAAMRSGRQSIGIEMDREWFDFATRRVEIDLLAESHAKDAA